MTRLTSSTTLSIAVAAVCALAGAGAPQSLLAQTPAAGTVNLLTTPPELTSKVAPNVVLTFDDSGSMGRNYMGDQRPYTGAGWGGTDQQNTTGSATWPSGGGPYLCAGVIDPRITDPADPRSWAMNGVYYNPNSNYQPPLMADGVTAFPNARFTAAWDNGRWNAGVLLRAVAAQTRVAASQGNVTGRDLGPSKGFATLALNGGYRVGERVQLTAGVDNLFDRGYGEHLNLAGNADFGYPADPVRINEPGRTAWMKLNLRY